MDYLLAFSVALIISMAMVPPLSRLARHWLVLDVPQQRKVHSIPVPRIGGIAMGVACIICMLLWLRDDVLLLGFVAASAMLLVFGALDDRFSLGAGTKALGQLIAIAVYLYTTGECFDTYSIAARHVLPHWLCYGLTAFFLLAVTNAVNLSDGLDGLAGGLTLLSCALLALLALSLHQPFVAGAAVILCGAIFGFLRFNTFPARIFMGDAGSQFLGFAVAALAVHLAHGQAHGYMTPLSPAAALLLVGLPLIDTLAVMIQRLRAGVGLFSADNRHIHHRLLALGFDHYEAVVAIYAAQCLLLLLAWYLRFSSDALIGLLFLSLVLLAIFGCDTLKRHGWQWRQPSTQLQGRSLLTRAAGWLHREDRLLRWAMRSASLLTGLYLVSIALLGHAVPADIAWLGVMAIVALAAALLWRQSDWLIRWLGRGALYLAVVTAVYLDHRASVAGNWHQAITWLFLPLLALSVGLTVRLSREQRFGATPVDLLLIFGAFALPNLPGNMAIAAGLGASVAKLMALFFAIEMVATLGTRLRVMMHGAGMAFFLIVAARAFWL